MTTDDIALCCVSYHVQMHEGLIVFSCRSGFYGVNERIEFKKKNDCWYVSTYTNMPGKDFMFAHIAAAHKYCVEKFGGDHSAAKETTIEQA